MASKNTQNPENSNSTTTNHTQWVSWRNHTSSDKLKGTDRQKSFREESHINTPMSTNRTKPDIGDWSFKRKASKAKQDYWEHLKKVNIGRWNGKWSHAGYERNIFKKNLCEILGGHLDLKECQVSRIIPLFLLLDLRGFRKYDSDVSPSEGGMRDKWPLIIFCICILVCWEEGRVYYPDSNAGEDKRDRVFASIADRLGLADDVTISCVGKIRYQLRNRLREPKNPPKEPSKIPNWSIRSSANEERRGEGYLK